MKAAAVYRPDDPVSLRIYYDSLFFELSALGVDIVPFAEDEPVPSGCDLLWDPGLCMRLLSLSVMNTDIPVVGSMHGLKAYSLPVRELVSSPEEEAELLACRNVLDGQWKRFKERIDALVTVSEYGKAEVVGAVGIDPEKVFTVYNGVDKAVFKENGKRKSIGKPYFFHVSSVNPIKNFQRLLEAYSLMPEAARPDLVAVVPGCQDRIDIKGVRLITETVPQTEMAEWYRGATALVFPSLRETFGMPVIEAMSCGVPVLTSNTTACAEISGGAAVLVDPRSVEELKNAMLKLSLDGGFRKKLVQKGLRQAEIFSWQKAAERLRQIFNQVVSRRRRREPRMRKLEVTTTAGCKINCSFCPHAAFYKSFRAKHADSKHMSFSVFKTCIDKLPADVGIGFGGMSEPFQNKECTEMVLYAKGRGHSIEIFTTLSGLDLGNLKRLFAQLALTCSGEGDRFYIHLPSDNNWERIPVDRELIEKIDFVLANDYEAEFHYHGENIHKDLQSIDFNGRLSHWPLHNRSFNETALIKKSEAKKGVISCVMNMEVNLLAPNGRVLLCCQDFGIDCVIGNLLTDDFDSLYKSKVFRNALESLQDDTVASICRTCHFAIEEEKGEEQQALV